MVILSEPTVILSEAKNLGSFVIASEAKQSQLFYYYNLGKSKSDPGLDPDQMVKVRVL
jgi:hypothetical protein